ncbi:Crp/Fnr family transcriptional regulator [Amycolatopsis sp. NEAU-NG30]|uniref:Crp/Fnr family transcriptional regulator n=1 Tax=Amycolatopsis melonis TaxID=3156488 RepID=A0ABV0LTG8_9PSEU
MSGDQAAFPRGSFLAGLPPKSGSALLTLGTAREFAPETVLLREGDTSTHVLLLLDGCVKITATTPEGQLALLAIRVGGDLVGELAAMDGQPRIATVTTAGHVRARTIGQAEFRRCLAATPEIGLAVSSSVGAKLRWATRRRVDFGSREVKVRLARVLLELAASYGIAAGRHIELGVALTQPELAALVGAAEPTVHRALAVLRRENIVETGYRRLCVRDRARLAAVADG